MEERRQWRNIDIISLVSNLYNYGIPTYRIENLHKNLQKRQQGYDLRDI